MFSGLATEAGLKLSRLPSGHSTRVVATRDMFAAGFELFEVMQAGSWKTPAMPARCGERLRAVASAVRRGAKIGDVAKSRVSHLGPHPKHCADHPKSHLVAPGPARSSRAPAPPFTRRERLSADFAARSAYLDDLGDLPWPAS